MIVFVHGSQSDRRVWDPLVALAPPGARISLLDLPDHGSAADEATPSPIPLRRALIEHVEALPGESVVLVGHSLGAHLVASILVELDKPVAHAFLISGFDHLRESDMQLYRAMADGLESGRLDLELLRDTAVDVLLGERHRRPEHDALVTAMQDVSLERALRSLRRGLELGPPGVTGYATPATVIHGSDDAAIGHELGASLASAGERAELLTIDTDSHLLPLTHTDELARLIYAENES